MTIPGLPTSSSTRAWAWRQRGCCWYRWGPEIMDSSHPTFSSLAPDCLFWVKTTQGRWSFWSRTVILSFGLLVLGRGSWSHGLSVLLPFCTLVYSSFKDDCECAGIDCELWLWMCRHSAYFRVDPHPRTHPGLPEVSFYYFKICDWSDSFQIWDILFIANFKTWIVWTLFRYRISFFYHFKIWIGRTLFRYGISFFFTISNFELFGHFTDTEYPFFYHLKFGNY